MPPKCTGSAENGSLACKEDKNPASMEVTNLFVHPTDKTGFEGINTQIDPTDWISEGKPAILEEPSSMGLPTSLYEQSMKAPTLRPACFTPLLLPG
jgi:hypothetical protein